MKVRIIVFLIIFLAGYASLRFMPMIYDASNPLLVVIAIGGAAISNYVLITKRGLQLNLKFSSPRLDQPLFQNARSLQRDFDVAILTIGFGFGGLLGSFLTKRTFSYEHLIIMAWGWGLLIGMRLYLKRIEKY